MHDYIQKALRTESIDLFSVPNARLLHAVVGINTEVGELFLATEADLVNQKEEVGDILWYVAIAAHELEASFDELLLLGQMIADDIGGDLDWTEPRLLFQHSIDLLDQMKRSMFYGLPLDDVLLARRVGFILLYLSKQFNLNDCMEANIRKLSKRYPEKFTTEAAANRDLAAEHEELSK